VGATPSNGGVRGALATRPEHVANAWLEGYASSTLRLPGAVDRDALAARIQPLATALTSSLGAGAEVQAAGGPLPRPGSSDLRDLEQQLAFAAAQLAAEGASGFDAAALVAALRDALVAEAADPDERRAVGELCDWLAALAFDAFATGARSAARERARELVEERAAVVCVAPDVPAALPLGNTEICGFESALSRLALLVIRVGARAAIIDANGLTAPAAPANLAALAQFCSHRKIAGAVMVIAVGLTAAELAQWREAAAAAVEIRSAESFLAAVEVALERSEYRLVSRGA
jgi:hypothetical protein